MKKLAVKIMVVLAAITLVKNSGFAAGKIDDAVTKIESLTDLGNMSGGEFTTYTEMGDFFLMAENY